AFLLQTCIVVQLFTSTEGERQFGVGYDRGKCDHYQHPYELRFFMRRKTTIHTLRQTGNAIYDVLVLYC
ncbi:MAG: hypothetical protein ACJ8AG_15175, partial [Ktedonobacteraceae bacterium]